MTKDDLSNIIDIIDKCRNEEKKNADRYIELNPDDAKERRHDEHLRLSGMISAWVAIREAYRDVWENGKYSWES